MDIKYVGKFGDSHYYGVGIQAVDPDGGDLTYGLSAEYFLDRTFKLDAGYVDSVDRWSLGAEKFFTEKASLGVEYFDDNLGHGLQLRGARRL